MNYMSYGHECIIYLLVTMFLSHLILDLVPPAFQRLRRVFATVPFPASAAFLLMISAYFLF